MMGLFTLFSGYAISIFEKEAKRRHDGTQFAAERARKALIRNVFPGKSVESDANGLYTFCMLGYAEI